MTIKTTFSKALPKTAKTIIVPIYKDGALSSSAKAYKKHIDHGLNISPNFKGKLGQSLVVTCSDKSDFDRVICLGLGDPKKLTSVKAQESGGKLYPTLKSLGLETAALHIDDDNKAVKSIAGGDLAANIAYGLHLRSYEFDRYKSKKKSTKQAPKLKTLNMVGDIASSAKAAYAALENITQGVFFARDLVNMPPNDLYPDAYAKLIKKELAPLGVKIEIIDEKAMAKNGMDAILAVGKGSERQPRMVIMRWNGASKDKSKPFGLVGKGVTFDTGGISIKPGGGMDEMKMDMGGSAAVVGTIKALALQKAKVNVVGIVGLAENMPSHNAYRPGDIIDSLSGKTIEVLNTDAEGRLVLADCLTHIQKQYKPRLIIDLATLTGAMMVALGQEYCGTFVNHDDLWAGLETASRNTGEKLWRMPLDEVWKEDMVSNVADLQNLGKSGRYGGACTAAGFLEHFIEEDTPWAHMDIAGTAWRKSDRATTPKYATGFGVQVLSDFITHA